MFNAGFQVVKARSFESEYQRFGGTCYLLLQGRSYSDLDCGDNVAPKLWYPPSSLHAVTIKNSKTGIVNLRLNMLIN